MQNDYHAFLETKRQRVYDHGIQLDTRHDFLYDWQNEVVEWACRKGRAAIFADCGLGKTPMQLVWANNIVQHADGNVLILTPLAVSHQTLREAAKFGVECSRSQNGEVNSRIVITNYEHLEKFNPAEFVGVVCDESSILKSFNGATRDKITHFMRKCPYRLLATATAAPNDYIELGTSSEALGHLGHIDMLNRFFVNDNNNSAMRRMYGEAPKWRFKGHAELNFWRWVTSWAMAIRKPSDLGYDDDGFVLPKLTEQVHLVEASTPPTELLFDLPAFTLDEQREERRRTIRYRCEYVASLVGNTGKPALVWCHLNDEGDLLEDLIDDAVQVKGSDSPEQKEERLIGFSDGSIRVLVTKPKIGAWGLNFQHCSHVVTFPSHSYEQYYQSVRRCWRFGQRNPVRVDIVLTEGERKVLENLQRKSEAADKMFDSLIAEMNNAVSIKSSNGFHQKEGIPSWL